MAQVGRQRWTLRFHKILATIAYDRTNFDEADFAKRIREALDNSSETDPGATDPPVAPSAKD
ncbi:MAG: hypothetical protein M1825_004521 [Sarcosagium campestre]|nr:MAG: hypothetical protein M1825_004521 [Sarcosagium campestre]